MSDITRAQLAAELGISERTLRRVLSKIPGLHCNRVGRRITFTPGDVVKIREAVRCPYIFVVAAKSGTREARSGSGHKPSPSQSSARERVRELTRKMLSTSSDNASEIIFLGEHRRGPR